MSFTKEIEHHLDKVNAVLIAIIIIGAVLLAYPYLPFANNSNLTAKSSGSNGATVQAVAQPFVDYYTTNGQILRDYIQTGKLYWVEPNGTLVPYNSGLSVVIIPGTLEEINETSFGFSVTASGSWLNGTVDLSITSELETNASSPTTYTVFNNQPETLSVGTASQSQSASGTYTSSPTNVNTLLSALWSSPVSGDVYYPNYYISISATAWSQWGQELTASATTTFSKIAAWEFANPTLSVSIGSSSVANQSLLGDLSTTNGQTALIIIIAIAAILLLMWRRHEA